VRSQGCWQGQRINTSQQQASIKHQVSGNNLPP
jgi:hypothetical protein